MSEDYIDIRRLHPAYEQRECWSCGHTWLRKARPAESVCRRCFMGQGDHEDVDAPTDYGELWYGDVSLAEKRRQYRETQQDLREGVLHGHVDTPRGEPTVAGVMEVDDGR